MALYGWIPTINPGGKHGIALLTYKSYNNFLKPVLQIFLAPRWWNPHWHTTPQWHRMRFPNPSDFAPFFFDCFDLSAMAAMAAALSLRLNCGSPCAQAKASQRASASLMSMQTTPKWQVISEPSWGVGFTYWDSHFWRDESSSFGDITLGITGINKNH